MSAEISLVPLFPLAIVGGAVLALGALFGAAASGVNRLIASEVERARCERERERAMLADRLQVQEKRQAAQRSTAIERATARKVLQKLGELTTARRAPQRAREAATRNFLSAERRRNEARAQAVAHLDEIAETLEQLPRNLLTDAEAPFGRLAEYVRRERARAADSSGVTDAIDTATLRTAVTDTIDAHLRRLERSEEARARVRSKAETLLDEALECLELAKQDADRADARELVQDLVAMIEDDQPDAGALGTLGRVQLRLSWVRKRIDQQVETEAVRTWLAGRVDKHLAALNYQRLDPLVPAHAGTMATGSYGVPGGGRVHLALQPDGRIAAQLRSEPSEAVDLERAEAKWCADAHELLRLLATEGAPYKVAFERRLSEVPVVALETAEELDREEEERARAASLAQESAQQRS